MTVYYRYSIISVCKTIIADQFAEMGIEFEIGSLNNIEIKRPLTADEHRSLKTALEHYGIEILSDQENALIDKIKAAITELVYSDTNIEQINLSDYLSQKLNYSYGHLSSLFSEATYMSIAHYTMVQKIERIKDLLIEGILTLTEISYRLNYSSVAHLSNQFKKITGLTPTRFKEIMARKRALGL